MPKQKFTEAKAAANERWNKKNKDRVAYLNARSAAKNFILKRANNEDLNSMTKYINERRKKLSS